MSDYQTSYPSPLTSPQTHTLAIASLIFGILGLVGICPGLGSIVAVVTGSMAQREIQADPTRYTGDGLAKAGLILGWVGVALTVLGICAVVAYFLFVAALIGSGEFEGSFRFAPGLVVVIHAALN